MHRSSINMLPALYGFLSTNSQEIWPLISRAQLRFSAGIVALTAEFQYIEFLLLLLLWTKSHVANKASKQRRYTGKRFCLKGKRCISQGTMRSGDVENFEKKKTTATSGEIKDNYRQPSQCTHI